MVVTNFFFQRKMNNSHSQSAAENSLLQFERLEKQLNGSIGCQTSATNQQEKRHPSFHPSIVELEGDDAQETLQLPAHEPFIRQGMGDGGADSDLPVELSYQRLVLQQNSPSLDDDGIATSNTSSIDRPAHLSPVPSSLSSIVGIQMPPKTTPRTTTTATTASTLMAPLKVPVFKHDDLHQPQIQLPPKSRSPLHQLNVPNFKQNDIHPPLQKTRPMYQSTPHNNKHTMHKPTTPNGHHQISPIPEECELDQIVSALIDDNHQKGGAVATTIAGADQRIVKNLITQLRDVIAQWDWAQARHRHVAKIYFERQTDELNAKWEQLSTEIAKFTEAKAEERAQIAKIRAGLRAEHEKQLGKKEADRIKQLEKELAEFKAKDARASRQACELRTQNRELKGVVRVREQSYTENMLRIKKLESQLVLAEQENSKLRTRLKLLRQEMEKGNNHHQQQQQQQQQQQKLRNVPRSAPALTQLNSSNAPSNPAGKQQQLRFQNVRDDIPWGQRLGDGGGEEPICNFRWMSSACGCAMAAQQGTYEKVQIDYLHAERLYEVRMPRGHLMRFMLSGHLELNWANGDRTLMLPDGERRELYHPDRPNFGIEIFLPTGVAYRVNAQAQWCREAFVPDPTRMSVRLDGSFAAKHVDDQPGLQINSPDFRLRRFVGTNAVKLALDQNAGIQLWLCTDNVLLVKHVFRRSVGNGANDSNSNDERAAAARNVDDANAPTIFGATNNNNSSNNNSSPTQKYVCFSLGRCRHINN